MLQLEHSSHFQLPVA